MSNSKKIGVIILNYLSYQETINCVNSFLNADTKNADVFYVIVENGSNNDSYDILANYFSCRANISIIKMNSNVGFARGNNEGYAFLKRKYQCDYYIFSNSDILVPDNIFNWMFGIYQKYDCDILGPDIYAPKLDIHQNPIKFYGESLFIVRFKLLKKILEKYFIKFFSINLKKHREDNSSFKSSLCLRDHPVHGSFIITNNRIFNYYSDFFDNRTFLYMEEYLLFLRCKKAKIRIMVSLSNQVVHLQGRSTSISVADLRKRKIIRLEREIESIEIYIKALREFLKGIPCYAEKM